MNEKLHRKTFLQRLGLGFASFFALPGLEKTAALHGETNQPKKKLPMITNIQPMGFQWETMDPFLFCVHHEDHFPKGNDVMGPAVPLSGRSLGDDFIIKDGFRMYHGKRVPGFPGHPHRGFETVTVVRKGIVDHADSLGAAGRYGNGDVQWMTAGKGVQHSEMFPCIHKDKENPMELFQIWLNLPAANKMVEPHFKMLWAETIPHHLHKDARGKLTEVEIIAGKMGIEKAPLPPPNSWAYDPSHEVAIWNIRMEPGARFSLPKASFGINRMLYFYQGNKIMIGETSLSPYHSCKAAPEAELLIQNGENEARILVLQGKPIGEQVIQYGPFVMNTKEEIHQAFEDYHRTQFGGWPWPKADQVHDRKLGRFAQHADGRREVKA